jgi:hypothetical protein
MMAIQITNPAAIPSTTCDKNPRVLFHKIAAGSGAMITSATNSNSGCLNIRFKLVPPEDNSSLGLFGRFFRFRTMLRIFEIRGSEPRKIFYDFSLRDSLSEQFHDMV